MRKLSSESRSFSNGETSWEDGDSGFSTEIKRLIDTANTVPMVKLFHYYSLKLNEHQRKITCPFPFHQNGREKTPSFYFYPKTNTYFCFGCKKGSTVVDLVSNMENISAEKASNKIIDIFNSDIDENVVFNRESFDEKLLIMMDFSNAVREFRIKNYSNEAQNFIENICRIYDDLNSKFSLNNDALRELVQNLLIKGIKQFKCV